MTDVLIRDLPDEVLAAVDAHAARLGISRAEYIRRRLTADAATRDTTVSMRDLQAFADLATDLSNPEVMSDAWR